MIVDRSHVFDCIDTSQDVMQRPIAEVIYVRSDEILTCTAAPAEIGRKDSVSCAQEHLGEVSKRSQRGHERRRRARWAAMSPDEQRVRLGRTLRISCSWQQQPTLNLSTVTPPSNILN